jgi:hypothetical protein
MGSSDRVCVKYSRRSDGNQSDLACDVARSLVTSRRLYVHVTSEIGVTCVIL